MAKTRKNRRQFMTDSATAAAGLLLSSKLASGSVVHENIKETRTMQTSPRIRLSVIGINHDHINGQIAATKRGGGELVSFYAKEPELAANFAKKNPDVKQAKDPKEILDDKSIQLVVSAGIPADRAPLGLEVMKSGKDYMSDKPGITSLSQLEEVRKVQKETKRIYSICYSERFENAATVRAGELVKAGAIGQVLQTTGLGPHRMNVKTRPEWFFHKERYGGI